MRVLVCGDRDWVGYVAITKRLCLLDQTDTTIIHGGCRGADQIAGVVAERLNMDAEEYPAQWTKHGRAAGPIRNQQMLDTGIDLVLAFHGNIIESKGTKDMVTRAEKAGVEVEICTS